MIAEKGITDAGITIQFMDGMHCLPVVARPT